nr:TBC1 domain family member 20 [Haemonchus contortus]
MPSYSEPPTPIHEVDYLCTQLETSSCDDINNLKPLGKSRVLASARYNCLKTKREEIARFLKDHANEDLDNYISELRCFARSNGGLVIDEYRAKIWPVLARRLVKSDEDEEIDYDSVSSVSDTNSIKSSSPQDTTHETDDEDELKSHPEWNQVALDVHRTLARFPPNITDETRTTLQDQLTPLIIRVLRTNPRFRYYQGFHDVCLTVILVCGKEVAYEVCKNLANHGPFRSYLLKSLDKSVLKELELLYVILSRADPQLERVLREVHLGTMFALSWPLTWFSHSLNHYQQIVRFFDVFLASPPLTSIYVSAAIVLKRKSAILTSQREMPIIHQLLMNMPNELHLDAILSDSLYLASLMPPLALKTEFTRLYRARARKINQRWPPISRYAITMVAAVGVAGAAYYFNLGSRFSFSF